MVSDARYPTQPSHEETLGVESLQMQAAISRRLFGRDAARPIAVGRYEILEALGRGAMGAVFSAHDPRLGRTVALKVLHNDEPVRRRREALVARLTREAKLLARLNHPNVVSVYDVGVEGNQVYIAMEYVRGRTLRAWLDRHRPLRRGALRAGLELFEQAAAGLAAAHEAGLIHRDFKPDNVLVGEDGRVRVVDFGLAAGALELQRADHQTVVDDAVALSRSPDEPTLTSTGQLVGTPAYMAPEQLGGGEVGPASDQYAFCVALYEALFGRRPHTGTTLAELAAKVTAEEVVIPGASGVPSLVRALLRRGLARDPSHRFASMHDIVHELRRTRGTGRRRTIAGIVVIAAVGGAALARASAPRPMTCSGAEDRVAAVWTPTVAESIREAFAATGRPFAQTAAETVRVALDTFTTRWSAEHRAACEATRIRGEESEEVFDRRIACLDRQLRDVAELVDVWREPTAATVDKAATAVESLPDVSECARIDALLAVERIPSDPQRRAAVEAVQDRIAKVEALHRAGRLNDAREAARGLVEAAEAAGHRPTLAEALASTAAVEQLAMNPDAVLEHNRRAIAIAVAAGDDALAARSAATLASHYATVTLEPNAALLWADMAESFAERAGGVPTISANAMIARGHALRQLGKFDDGLGELERAVEALAAIDDRSSAYAKALADFAGQVAMSGRIEEGRKLLARANEVLTSTLGEDHPDVALNRMNTAAMLIMQGIHDQGESELRVAVDSLEKTLGHDHLHVAAGLVNLAALAERRLDWAESTELLGRAVEIRRKVLGPDHREVAETLLNLAGPHWLMGAHQAARESIDDALRIYTKALDPSDPAWAAIRVRAGYVLVGAGDVERGLSLGERGINDLLADQERNEGEDWRMLALYATSLRDAGRFEQAVEWDERVVSLLRQAPDLHKPELASAVYRLAKNLWDSGRDRPRARSLAEEALELMDTHGERSPGAREEVATWLDTHDPRRAG